MGTILDLLQKVQLIDDRAHDAVRSRTRSRSGGHIVQQVAELGLATESSIARAVSVELGLPRIDLQMTPPETAALELLDARICADRFVLPVALRENGELLWLAMADPTDEDSIAVVQRRTQKRVRPAVAGPSEILRAVRQLYEAPAAGDSGAAHAKEQAHPGHRARARNGPGPVCHHRGRADRYRRPHRRRSAQPRCPAAQPRAGRAGDARGRRALLGEGRAQPEGSRP